MNPFSIINKLTEELKNNPLIKGFVLVGSQVRETVYKATEYSDAEAYIIVEDSDIEKVKRQLPHLVKPLGKTIFSYENQWAGFSTVFENLFRLELPLVKLSELKSVFSRPKSQPVKVLVDKTNGRLEKVLDERVSTMDFEKFFQDKIVDFWYMFILAVQYYKKGEIWNARSALQILQSSLIKIFELLNDPNILLLETNKRVEQFLTEKQLELLRQVSPAYKRKDVSAALKKIAGVFAEYSTLVANKYHFVRDTEIEKEVYPKVMNLLKH